MIVFFIIIIIMIIIIIIIIGWKMGTESWWAEKEWREAEVGKFKEQH